MNVEYESVSNQEIIRLNQHIEEYEEMFNSIIEPLIMLDENLSFSYVNEAACLMLELSREKLTELRLTDFLEESSFFDFDSLEDSSLKSAHKGKRRVQLLTGTVKELEFIRIGTLTKGKSVFRLEDVSKVEPVEENLMSPELLLGNGEEEGEGILLMDRQGVVVEANSAFTEGLKINKRELIGKKMSELMTYEYEPTVKKGVDKIFSTLKSMGELEVTLHGKPCRFSFSTSSTVGNEYFKSTFSKITESKIMEKKLETSERIFAELFDQSMEGIIFWNEDGIIFRVNQSACKIFESTREEMIGSDTWKYIFKKNHYFKRMLATFERDGQVRDDIFYKMPNNQIKLLELTAKKYEGDGYNVTIFRNATERWEIEKELRKSEKKFRKIFEGSMDGLILWNKEGFTDINESGKVILGISKESLLSLSIQEFIEKIPGNADELSAYMEDVYKKGIYSSVVALKFADGSVKHIEFLTRSNLYSNLNLSVFRDVSKNLEMQEQIRKSDTLHVVGELAAGIAHEIRNPMTALKGFIQLLEDMVQEDFSTYFHIITSEIQRIETIITEFLVLAKPQALQYQEQDVQMIMKETLELLAAQALLNNVRFETDFEGDESNVFCEANQLKQVFINIIKNALEVMPDGGIVRIKSSQVSKKHVCISIIDQGNGISEDKLKKLGEPFYTTKERGTGLGLMVSYKIIEEHNGYIEVESEVDKGTSFHIFLPLRGKAQGTFTR
ncbi:PAS domain S-box protein [Peribacillus sp. NPDC097675]|uniref:PAS domain-containing sensor histidine kinase n=1 Tax=Peribacillus sp. NPDC097675 TaxID=3390618 RepID=UPI003D018E79